jgi:hypothetical protein
MPAAPQIVELQIDAPALLVADVFRALSEGVKQAAVSIFHQVFAPGPPVSKASALAE